MHGETLKLCGCIYSSKILKRVESVFKI